MRGALGTFHGRCAAAAIADDMERLVGGVQR
jgi:hypothetical protein